MNILYCGDSNISDGVILSTLSLLNNTSEQLNIYILTASIKTPAKDFTALSLNFSAFMNKLVKQKNENNFVKLIDITELFYRELPSANLNTRFTPCCMLRLFADKVSELPDRILYLDNDVICRKDFYSFYNQDISNYELGGVLDYYGSWFFRNNIFKRDYINSGVLLLNLEKIRKSGLFERCRIYCKNKKMFMPDQSAINKLAEFKKIYPRKYNEQRKIHHNTVFQHFTTGFRFFPYFHSVSVKPWDINRMHKILKLYEYDCLLEEYKKIKTEFEKEKNNESTKRDTDILYNR